MPLTVRVPLLIPQLLSSKLGVDLRFNLLCLQGVTIRYYGRLETRD